MGVVVAIAAAAAALAVVLSASAALAGHASTAHCTLPGWPVPSAVGLWPLGGARERCFCAYASLDTITPHGLDEECPSWPQFVTTDGQTPDRVSQHEAATVIGRIGGNASTSRYGYVGDWAVDLGSGWNSDCNRKLAPRCEAVGAHVLSIPRRLFLRDCCTEPRHSLAALLRAGRFGVLCPLLRDLISGGVRHVPKLSAYDSCREESQEPTLKEACLAQCFHIKPDVFYAHLHTTAGVLRIRSGPVDSGLGPERNESEADDEGSAYGRYNLCACEPKAWGGFAPGRGSCPLARPADEAYVPQATLSLCRNLAGVAGVDPRACDACGAFSSARRSVV